MSAIKTNQNLIQLEATFTWWIPNHNPWATSRSHESSSPLSADLLFILDEISMNARNIKKQKQGRKKKSSTPRFIVAMWTGPWPRRLMCPTHQRLKYTIPIDRNPRMIILIQLSLNLEVIVMFTNPGSVCDWISPKYMIAVVWPGLAICSKFFRMLTTITYSSLQDFTFRCNASHWQSWKPRTSHPSCDMRSRSQGQTPLHYSWAQKSKHLLMQLLQLWEKMIKGDSNKMSSDPKWDLSAGSGKFRPSLFSVSTWKSRCCMAHATKQPFGYGMKARSNEGRTICEAIESMQKNVSSCIDCYFMFALYDFIAEIAGVARVAQPHPSVTCILGSKHPEVKL